MVAELFVQALTYPPPILLVEPHFTSADIHTVTACAAVRDEVSLQDFFAHWPMVGKLWAVERGFVAGASLRELVFVALVACFAAGATRDTARLTVMIAKLGWRVLALVMLTWHRASEHRTATYPAICMTKAVLKSDPCTDERQHGKYRCGDEQQNGPNFVMVAPFPGDLRKHLVVEVEAFHEEFVHSCFLR